MRTAMMPLEKHLFMIRSLNKKVIYSDIIKCADWIYFSHEWYLCESFSDMRGACYTRETFRLTTLECYMLGEK